MTATVIEPRSSFSIDWSELWSYRDLWRLLALRQLRGRYRSTALRYGWVILRPLALCAIYLVVFGVLFGIDAGAVPYPIFAYFGVVIYLFVSGVLTDTANSLSAHADLIRKAYFPRLLAPLSSVALNSIDLALGLALTGAIAGLRGSLEIQPKAAFFAPLLAGLGLLALGMGLLLAAVSVRRRDALMGLPVVLRVLIYTMPCLYPAALVPQKAAAWYYLNPLAVYMQALRWSLFEEPRPPGWALAWAIGLTIGLLFLGLRRFDKAQRTMADVL